MGIGIRRNPFKRRFSARLHPRAQRVIAFKRGKFRRQFRRHGGDGFACVNAEPRNAGTAIFNVLRRVVAMHTGDLQKRIFRRHRQRQFTFEFVAYGFTATKPGFALHRRVNNIRPAHAARQAIEHAAAARMRVAAHQRSAGHGVAVVGHQLMADALLAAHVMHALDTKTFGEFAACAVRTGSDLIGCGHAVIEHHDYALRVAHALNVAPVARHKIVVEQNNGVELHRHHVTRYHTCPPTFRGENFFSDGHAHGGLTSHELGFDFVQPLHAHQGVKLLKARAQIRAIHGKVFLHHVRFVNLHRVHHAF